MNKDSIPLEIRRHKHVATVREALGDSDVLIGVSGGADSIALLLLSCAAAMQESASFEVTVAHIHHGLRDASDDEQRIVETLCSKLGVRCICSKVQVQSLNGSLAAGARDARYKALANIASTCNIQVVAVAHHAGDQLETMLMALCRGGGLRALAGMAPSRTLIEGIDLLRPLLSVDKAELEKICTTSGFAWCQDPTNEDRSTPRGRLRIDVIPVLRQLWRGADRHACNGSEVIRAAADVFEAAVPEGTQWTREVLSSFPTPIIAAAVHRAIGEHATFETIQMIANAVTDDVTEPREFSCGGGFVATVTAHQVNIHHT